MPGQKPKPIWERPEYVIFRTDFQMFLLWMHRLERESPKMALAISQAKDLKRTTTRDLPGRRRRKVKHGARARTKPIRKKRPSR